MERTIKTEMDELIRQIKEGNHIEGMEGVLVDDVGKIARKDPLQCKKAEEFLTAYLQYKSHPIATRMAAYCGLLGIDPGKKSRAAMSNFRDEKPDEAFMAEAVFVVEALKRA
jgi:hypothetical protein